MRHAVSIARGPHCVGILVVLTTLAVSSGAISTERLALRGRLSESWTCTRVEGGHECLHGYLLEGNDGRLVELRGAAGTLPWASGEEIVISGQRAAASADGRAAGAGPVAVQMEQLAAIAAKRKGGTRGRVPATGLRRYAMLLVRFADTPDVTPLTQLDCDGMLGAEDPGLDSYFRGISYDQLSLAGTRSFGWYTLPRPYADYRSRPNQFDLTTNLADAIALADAEVDFSQFEGIIVMLNDRRFPYDGLTVNRSLKLDGRKKSYGLVWVRPGPRGGNSADVAHEIGHTLGLVHSSGPYGFPYDSRWDLMSYGRGSEYPPFGYLPIGMSAYSRWAVGWLPEARCYLAKPQFSSTLHLERLERPSLAGYLIARIPMDRQGKTFYTVEARRRVGHDGSVPGDGVIIHSVDPTLPDRRAQVVDPDQNGNPNDDAAIWLPGETFTDAARGIEVAVLSDDLSGYTVRITRR